MLVRKRRDLEPFGWDSVDGTSSPSGGPGSLVLPIAGWVGGDWNHGILCSIYWEWKIISTDEVHHFSEG